ncbi:MAG: DUF5709 domain-containing protein [Streptosporangiaceae bacterium]
MTHDVPERDPRSKLEDEGIPDLQAGTPAQQWAVDPQEQPVPGDDPEALNDFGTTASEEAAGEPLDGRLGREVPDVQPGTSQPGAEPDWPAQPEEPSGRVWDPPRPAGRLVASDQGTTGRAEPDEVAREVGPDRGGFSAEESAVRVDPDGPGNGNGEQE